MTISATSSARDRGVLDASAVFALSIPDAVRASGLSRSALYLAMRSGSLRARKAGKHTLIEADELRRYIESLPFAGEAA